MYEKELNAMLSAVRLAAKHIMSVYATDFAVEIKSDDSPVTLADKGADEILRKTLAESFPDYGFLTEESKDTGERKTKEFVFIIDPVDGTSDFVAKDGQFCTNVALARNGEVVVGVIHLPASGISYYAVKGEGIEPFFTQFCNGTTSICDGLSQWGTVTLANEGLLPYQILR